MPAKRWMEKEQRKGLLSVLRSHQVPSSKMEEKKIFKSSSWKVHEQWAGMFHSFSTATISDATCLKLLLKCCWEIWSWMLSSGQLRSAAWRQHCGETRRRACYRPGNSYMNPRELQGALGDTSLLTTTPLSLEPRGLKWFSQGT